MLNPRPDQPPKSVQTQPSNDACAQAEVQAYLVIRFPLKNSSIEAIPDVRLQAVADLLVEVAATLAGCDEPAQLLAAMMFGRRGQRANFWTTLADVRLVFKHLVTPRD